METAVSFMGFSSGYVSLNEHYGKQNSGSFRPLDFKLSIIVLGEKRQVVGPLVRPLFSPLRNPTRPQVCYEPHLALAFKLIGMLRIVPLHGSCPQNGVAPATMPACASFSRAVKARMWLTDFGRVRPFSHRERVSQDTPRRRAASV